MSAQDEDDLEIPHGATGGSVARWRKTLASVPPHIGEAAVRVVQSVSTTEPNTLLRSVCDALLAAEARGFACGREAASVDNGVRRP